MEKAFAKMSGWLSVQIGRSHTFIITLAVSCVWLVLSFTNKSERLDSWLGAATGVLSILLLVLLQHSQNHGTAALHTKLDALVLAMPGAPNALVAAEMLEPEALERQRAEIAARAVE